MASSSDEEVAALDRIMTRLALTKEDQLEQLVGKLLCPVLKKLAVTDTDVRTKVFQLLGLISTKVKAAPTIKLPAKLLLDLINASSIDPELLRNTAIVYFQLAFERCSPAERFDLVGSLLNNIAAKPPAQRTLFLQLAHRGLEFCSKSLPTELEESTEKLHTALPFLVCKADLDVFLNHALKTMLYLPNFTLRSRHDINPGAEASPSNLLPLLRQQNPVAAAAEQARSAAIGAAISAEAAAAGDDAAAPSDACPGLAAADVDALVRGNLALDASALCRQKLALLALISAAGDAVSPQACVLHLQAACCDSNGSVASAADTLLRKKCGLDSGKPDVDVEDRALLARVFTLLLGSNGAGGPAGAAAATAGGASGAVTQPASYPLQVRLLRMCCKSIAAANFFPQSLQVIASGLYGKTATLRVKQSAMEFAVWVFKHATDAQLKPMAPIVFKGLLHMLTTLEISEQSQVMMLRGFLYQAVGQLAVRVPQLFKDHPDTPEMLFGALSAEPAGIRATVQEAINSMAGAYAGVTGPAADQLRKLLTSSLASRHDSVRLCAITWARQVYPFDDPYARHLCLVGAADTKHEIAQAALRGLGLTAALDPGAMPAALPTLESMLLTLRTQYPRLRTAPQPGASLAMPATSMHALLCFLRACAAEQATRAAAAAHAADAPAAKANGADASGAAPMDGVAATDAGPAVAAAVAAVSVPETAGVDGGDGSGAMEVDGGSDEAEAVRGGAHSSAYLLLLEHALVRDAPTDLQLAAFQALLALAASDREFVTATYSGRTQYLLGFVTHINAEVRTAAARMLGIVAAGASDEAVCATLASLQAAYDGSAKADAKKFEEQHGSLIAAGIVCAVVAERSSSQTAAAVKKAVEGMVAVLGSGDIGLACGAGLALGYVQLIKPLPLEMGDVPAEIASGPATSAAGTVDVTVVGVVNKLVQLTKDPRSEAAPKLRLQCITALGYLAHGCQDKALMALLVKSLLAMTPSGDSEDVHFTVGEALAMAFGGVTVTPLQILLTDFPSLAAHYRLLGSPSTPDVTPTNPSATPANAAHPEGAAAVRCVAEDLILEAVWAKGLASAPSARCGACVWLVSLLTYCHRHARLLPLLLRAQETFAQLLGDSNELTQEMASKGTSIVYELGDDATKEALVESLVGTLQGTAPQRKAIKVDNDSAVFDKGALGKAPGGGSISTYKELCSLATDMGQPDLIYKFMDLANQNAALNTRRGAAFGVVTIAGLSRERLEPHIASLLPKLYRYQYDPNAKVQEAMKQILSALVPQKSVELDKHFDAVLKDLLKELGSRLWRNRQAACLATADLLQGRRWPAVAPHFLALWTMTLRVADDIKESVRENGGRLFRVVKALTIRLADKEHTAGPDSQAAIDIVMPLLLEKGILSNVGFVKSHSIDTVSSIVDVAAPAQIARQLPAIVSAMLESLSSLESSRLNELQMHAQRLGVDGEKLEDVRVNASHRSPMQSALERCSKLITPDLLPELSGILSQLIKRGTGLNTRVGAARYAVTLQSRLPQHMQKTAGDLLKALMQAIQHERSPVVRKAYAYTIGSLATSASAKRAEWLVDTSLELASSTGDSDARLVAGMVVAAIARQAPDVVSAAADKVVPAAFRGRFDSDAGVATLWGEVWSEGTVSEATAMRLYGGDIVGTLTTELQRDEWPLRIAAAKALSGMADSAPDALRPHAQPLVSLLLSQLGGRLWQGKAALLDTIGAITVHCQAEFCPPGSSGQQVTDADVVNALVLACQKQVAEYRDGALTALASVLTGLKGRDHLALLGPILEAAHVSATAPVGDAKTNEDKETAAPMPLIPALAVLAAACHRASPTTTAQHLPALTRILQAVLRPQQPWPLRMQAFKTMAAAVLAAGGLAGGSEVGVAPSGQSGSIADAASVRLVSELVACAAAAGEDKTSQVRIASLDSLKALILATAGASELTDAAQLQLAEHLRSVATSDRTSAVRAHADSVLALVQGQQDRGAAAMDST